MKEKAFGWILYILEHDTDEIIRSKFIDLLLLVDFLLLGDVLFRL